MSITHSCTGQFELKIAELSSLSGHRIKTHSSFELGLQPGECGASLHVATWRCCGSQGSGVVGDDVHGCQVQPVLVLALYEAWLRPLRVTVWATPNPGKHCTGQLALRHTSGPLCKSPASSVTTKQTRRHANNNSTLRILRRDLDHPPEKAASL